MMQPDLHMTVVGAGPAGSECAWQLAQRGIHVTLIDMKPQKYTPAHRSPYFGELVCSNSLRSDELSNAVGLLKAEMRSLGSLFLESADLNRVPAGGALAVDREGFARTITEKLFSHPNIRILSEEVTEIPEGNVVIASGPLSSEAIAAQIRALTGGEGLHFYDAVAPIVTLESVDMESAFFASRYDKGTADYVNCPMDRDEYLSFVGELTEAKEAEVHGLTTVLCSKAACRWRLWPDVESIPCGTGRSSPSGSWIRAPAERIMPLFSSARTMRRGRYTILSAFRRISPGASRSACFR